jgi:hypothetical protein
VKKHMLARYCSVMVPATHLTYKVELIVNRSDFIDRQIMSGGDCVRAVALHVND